MGEHYLKNVIQAEAFCRVCGKMTPHDVWSGRLGSCQNEHVHPAPKSKEPDEPRLFD